MQLYDRTRAVRGGAVFYIVLFILVFIGMGYFFVSDRGKFFDLLPYFCIPSAVINLVLLTFYFVKRNVSGYIFTLFFMIFIAGIIISSFYGPFAIANSAEQNYINKKYIQAAADYEKLLEKYPTSKHAGEALKKLPYSYYLSGKYNEAVFYLEESIEKDAVDQDELEVKNIFAECYMQIAKGLAEKKMYSQAAADYLKSIDYLKEIEKNFPDTNDAFIAKYKIPEYLIETAVLYQRAELWDDAAIVLKQLIGTYPDSDYYSKAYDMLFGTYVSIAIELKNEGNYAESIKSFLKVYEMPSEIIDAKQHETTVLINYFFSGAPSGLIIKAADEFFLSARYYESMIAYDYILKNYPDREPEILENTVKAKIYLTDNMEHEVIIPSEPVGSFTGKGMARTTFENKTEYVLILYIGGLQYNILRLDKNSLAELELIAGEYEIAAEFDNPDASLLFGKFIYEDGKRYKEIFTIEDTGNGG